MYFVIELNCTYTTYANQKNLLKEKVKSEEGGTAFDGVWLKPENDMPSKSSTLSMDVVVMFPSASSLVSKGLLPPSMLGSSSFSFGTAGTADVCLLFRIVWFCVVDGSAISVDLFSRVFG